MTIYKYPLRVLSNQEIQLPEGAQILSCKVQNGHPMLWALVNPDEEDMVNYDIQIIGTGHDAARIKGYKFIDTFLIENDSLVFHVFASEAL